MAIAAALGLILPSVAHASTGCDALNSGVLNHNSVFSAGTLTSTTAADTNSNASLQFVRSNTTFTDTNFNLDQFAPNNATTYSFDTGDVISYTATLSGKTGGSSSTLRVYLRSSINNANTANAFGGSTPSTTLTNDGSDTRNYTVPANMTAVGFRIDTFNSNGQPGGTVTITASCVSAAPPPTLTSFTYGSVVAYNPGGASPTTIDVAAGGGATNSPTNYAVSNASGGTYAASASTTGGGTVSISSAGIASYTPRLGYRGNDTFFARASNSGGTSTPPATVTVTVGNPTITASLTGSGAKVGTVLSGYAVTPAGGNSPYVCALASGSLPPGVSFVTSSCALQGTPTTPGTYNSTVNITDSSVTGANGGTPSPYTQSGVAVNNFTVTQDPPTVTGVTPNIGPTAGNTAITITGTNFYNVQTVTVGGNPATNVVPNANGTSITATTPAGSGAGNVIVTTVVSGSAIGAGSAFTYSNPPAQPTVLVPANGASIGSTTPTYSGVSDANVTITVVVDGTPLPTTTADAGGNWSRAQPTALSAGSHTVYAFATNAQSQNSTNSATNTFTVTPAPVANSFTASAVAYNPGGAAASSFSVAGQTSGNPTSYAVGSATTAQGGSVSIDSAGLVSYTPPTGFRGNDSFQYNATNAGGPSPNATVTVPVSNPVFTTTLTGSGTRGTALTGVQINVSGGQPVYNCNPTPVSGALPSGVAIQTNCAITGTPAASGTFNFTVSITDSSIGTGPFTATSSTLSLVVAAPTLALSPAAGALPGATAGASYSQSFIASGGTATYSYAVTSGALPSGITLSGGTISGTPTAVGTATFTITATDSSGNGGPYTIAQLYSIAVSSPVITLSPATLANGTIGTAYTASVSASGGNGAYTYTITSGATPTGVTMQSDGTFTGTPSAGGAFTFTVTATDATTGPAAPYGGSQSYTITIGAPTITLGALTPSTATVGTSYSALLSASGGTGPYSYAVSSGALPAGVTLTGNTLSGTPTAAGSFTFDITATDSSTGAGPYTGTRSYTLTVGAPTISVSPGSLPNATAGVAYSQALGASGGTAPYSFAVTTGALPAGLSITGSTLSGTPSAGGTFNFTITATDQSTGTGAPFTGSTAYTLTVAPATVVINQTTLPDGRAGTPYSQALTASGGNGTYSFAVTAGALPPGWNLSASGVLSGTATASNTFTFTITATDQSTGTGAPYSGSRSYTVNVFAPNFTLTPPTLSASVGLAYSGAFVAGGGTAPYTYQQIAGTLPTGLSFASDGTLSGTPTATGTFNFTVRAQDSTAGGPFAVAGNFNFTVSVATLNLTPSTLPNGRVGAAYNETFTTTGGTAPYSYAVTAGALPAGLTLDPTSGIVSGTPTAGGSFSITVTATDSSGGGGPFSTSRGYTLAIDPATITLAPTTLPDGTPGTPYSQALTASGGTAPYEYTHTGTLPPGLSLSAGGVISGTPNTAGTFTFTVAVEDESTGTGPYTTNQPYTLTIGTPTITVDTASLPNATVAASYSQTITASGGVAPYSFAVTAGTLPAGVTLSTGGVLSGTPSEGGSFAITVTATDSSGGTPFSGSRPLTLVVDAPTIALSPAALPAGQMEAAYSQALSASGGTAPYSFAVTAGALPAGLTLATDGTLAGTPSVNGSFTFTVTATDSSGGSTRFTGSQAYTLAIAVPNAPVAGATSANVAYGSSDNAIPLVLSGGTATSVAIASPPSHGTATASGTNILYTPAPGYYGADSFTYTASNDGGTSPAATASITVSTPAAPTAADVSNVAIPYDSSGTPIDLGPFITGVHSGVVIATNPAHGTVTVAGDIVTYIPTAGYFGADAFSYSATGPGGSSNVASVTLEVAIPPVPVAGNVSNVAVPYNSSGTAIELSSAITGVRTSVAIATNPAHGTVTVAGEVVTYIPTANYYGTDSFTYTATGPGGTSSPGTVTLQVATPPVPTAVDRSGVAIPYNSAGTPIDLASDISGVYTSVAITTAPTNGTATISGTVVSYTPTTDYYGADSFAYTVTGPGGSSTPATVGLSVAAPPPPQTNDGAGSVAGSTSTTGAQSVQIDLSALVTGDYDRIEIATPPAHGTVTLSGNPSAGAGGGIGTLAGPRVIATYTPAMNYVGSDSFSFVAVGPGGTSAPAEVGITVVGQVPVALPKTAQVGDGQTVSVLLTEGATEGPFTGATIVSVVPAGDVTATIVAVGAGASQGYRLDVSAAARFSGTVVVTYTLSNAYGTSAPATVTVSVAARPDPTTDPNVRAISDAQAEVTRRFARTQVDNFMRRTEQLHGDGAGSGGNSMGVTLNSRDGRGIVEASPAFDASALEITERMRRSAEDPAMGQVLASREGMRWNRTDRLGSTIAPPAITVAERNAARKASGLAGEVQPLLQDEQGEEGGRRVGSLGLWSGGAVDIGTQDATTDRSKITATSAGLSAGADLKLSEGITVGIGGGYGNDMSKIDGGAASVRSNSTLFAAYASLEPVEHGFIDGMVGRGDLSFRTRRLVGDTGATAIGSRDGSFTVGALALGIDKAGEVFSWSFYGRGEVLDAKLGGYVESGADRYNLRFDERKLTSVTGTLGARFELKQKYDWAIVTPRLRVEWNHEFADADAQRLDYADIPGTAMYGIDTQGWSREQFQLSLGSRFALPSLWSFDFEAGFRGASGQRSGTMRVQITKEF